MSRYTKQDIIDMIQDNDVEFIRLQFTDIFGTLKNVAITASQIERALNNECMFDGSAIEGFVRIEESDMYLHPDLDTFQIFPWRPQPRGGRAAGTLRTTSCGLRPCRWSPAARGSRPQARSVRHSRSPENQTRLSAR